MDPIPPELFLERFPPPIRALADALRSTVVGAVPEALERVRPGWHLIGYDLPLGRRRAYFAYVAPEQEQVHLGFEHGVAMHDPDGLLEGAHLGLRQVRYVTFRPGDRLPVDRLAPLVREAARVAPLPRDARVAQLLDRG